MGTVPTKLYWLGWVWVHRCRFPPWNPINKLQPCHPPCRSRTTWWSPSIINTTAALVATMLVPGIGIGGVAVRVGLPPKGAGHWISTVLRRSALLP